MNTKHFIYVYTSPINSDLVVITLDEPNHNDNTRVFRAESSRAQELFEIIVKNAAKLGWESKNDPGFYHGKHIKLILDGVTWYTESYP